MIWLQVLIGLSVLFYGRRLFWLFVGAVGFMVAMKLAKLLLTGQPEWEVVVVALGAGAVGAICALALERAAVAIAGFVAGGAITVRVLQVTHFEGGPLVWLVILAGAVLGALVVARLFDGALIVLSSAVGASLVADCVATGNGATALVFAGLLVVGVVAQTRQFRRPQPRSRRLTTPSL